MGGLGWIRPGDELKEKARRSLAEALILLERGYVDGAASRLYYAAFQAAVFALESQGRKPSDFRPGATLWAHQTVVNQAALVRGRADDVDLLQGLLAMRRQADYLSSQVRRGRIQFLLHEVIRFVDQVTA